MTPVLGCLLLRGSTVGGLNYFYRRYYLLGFIVGLNDIYFSVPNLQELHFFPVVVCGCHAF